MGNYSWMNILISSMSIIQWGAQFIWKKITNKIKFSLVNKKEIEYEKQKLGEHSMWIMVYPRPYPILVQRLTGLLSLRIRYVDSILQQHFLLFPVLRTELADKGSKLRNPGRASHHYPWGKPAVYNWSLLYDSKTKDNKVFCVYY